MNPLYEDRSLRTPRPYEARSAIRWIATNNPFYAVSAGLFLAGLWLSFGDLDQAEDTWTLMAGLIGYTLLLAGTAYALVHFAKVWDDARTVLLLVVLMFLATSVTFDRVLIDDVIKATTARGISCFLMGLVFAILVSEGLLHGIGLVLPAFYRVPYYLILSLFFLYPLALVPLLQLQEPRGEAIMWGLFGFSSVAGLVFLTLLPAIHSGKSYLRGNGSPWPWPLYPWSLFGLLALAVPGRAMLLCYSMHLIDVRDLYDTIFGLYFLVPFGLALALLVLEMGLVSGHSRVVWAALISPVGLVALAQVGLRSDRIHDLFLNVFTERLGAGPSYLALAAAAFFYAYAALRRVPHATEMMTAALAVLAISGSKTYQWDGFVPLRQIPLLAAAVVQLGIGVWQRESWRCLLGCMAGIASLALPTEADSAALRLQVSLQLVLLTLLTIGLIFDDELGRLLRVLGSGLMLLVCCKVIFAPASPPQLVPDWGVDAYPLLMAALLAAYGFWLWHYPSFACAGLILLCWSVSSGWHFYRAGRQLIIGLDYLLLSLALFALALLVSLGKAGILSAWLARWQVREAPSSE